MAVLSTTACGSSTAENASPSATNETATPGVVGAAITSTPLGEDQLLLALFGPESLPRSGESFEVDAADSGRFPNGQFANSTFRLDDTPETWSDGGRLQAYCIWLTPRDADPVAVQIVAEEYRDISGAQAGVREYASEPRQVDGHAARGYEFFDLAESRLDGPWDEALAQSSGYRTGEVEFATQSVTLRMGTLVGFVRIDHAPSVAPPFTAEELAQILARRLAAVRDGAANRPAVLELG